MSLTLHVDAARWRAHLDATMQRMPGLVPVAKGNGYGFGLTLLRQETRRLHERAAGNTLPGATGGAGGSVAVGTYLEAGEFVGEPFGEVLVLEPYRPGIHAGVPWLADPALVHTVTAAADLRDLLTRSPGARVVLEGLTSMNRHGMPPAALRALLSELRGAQLAGGTLHLPLGSGHVAEVQRWLAELPQVRTWYLSHTSAEELARLRQAHPGRSLRPRVGTALWLGDEGALSVRGHVLDVRRVANGDRAGYRGRRLREGHLVVASGGTAHGVAMEAPSAAASPRQRAVALAEGLMEALGWVRSPFRVAGGYAWFVEPPHMQVSLLALPRSVDPPAVGDELAVRVRHTTLRADAVALG